jgi:hypothetical protein
MPKTYFPKTNDDELASLLKRIAALEARIQKEQEGLTDEKRKNVAGGIFLDFMALIRPTASSALLPNCSLKTSRLNPSDVIMTDNNSGGYDHMEKPDKRRTGSAG